MIQKYRSHARSLQHDILDALDEARASGITFAGGGNGIVTCKAGGIEDERYAAAGWNAAGPATWYLPDDVYDLRETLQFLATKLDRRTATGQIVPRFRVRFSEATQLLSQRGELIVDAPDLPNGNRRRFARPAPEPWPGFARANPLERQIMERLDDAHVAAIAAAGDVGRICGSSMRRADMQRFIDAGWERIDRNHWHIPVHVIDVRATHAYLRPALPLTDGAYHRAIANLCDVGALICEAPDLPNRKHRRFAKRRCSDTAASIGEADGRTSIER